MRKTFSFAHDAVYQIVNGSFYLILQILNAETAPLLDKKGSTPNKPLPITQNSH